MERKNVIPLYQQIKEDIKTAIEKGKYQTNEKIPTEKELSIIYSASRITIRRAVEELSSDGYLVKKQGLGTFVNSPRIHRKITNYNNLESFTTTCRKYNMNAGANVLSKQIVCARQEECDFFKIPPESFLIYIERLRTADGKPIFLENIFLPYEEFKVILEMDLQDVSIYDTLKNISSRSIYSTTKRTIELTRTTSSQSKKLNIKQGEPLFYMNYHAVDENYAPLLIGKQYYIGSRYMFEL